jgi:mRNA-degrading endonuclease toxin of MazEF toxin-antitoxin module
VAESKPEQGRIILAEVLDPQNRNPKKRHLVIVSRNDQIEAGKPFWCVAITGTLPRKLTNEFVLLPFQRSGRSLTGLTKRCAAMCSWRLEIDESQVIRYVGRVPDDKLDAIIQAIEDLQVEDAQRQDSPE